MTNAAIRNKLIHFIAEASEEKINALYVLLQGELQDEDVSLSEEQMSILEEQRVAYLTGKDKGRPWQEVLNEIRNKK